MDKLHENDTLTPEQAHKILLTFKDNDKNKIHYSAAISTLKEKHPFLRACESERGRQQRSNDKLLPKIVELSGGQLFELCGDFNYGNMFFEFAQSLVESILTVPLKSLPNTETIEVHFSSIGYTTIVPDDQWTYNEKNNSIILPRNVTLGELPPISPRFKITYEPAL